MRKWILLVLGLVLCTSAWAVSRVPQRSVWGDVQLSNTKAIVIDANVYFKGVTVGDSVIFYDQASVVGAPTASRQVMSFYAPTANGRLPLINLEGFVTDYGLYMDVTGTGTAWLGVDIIYQ
jgi:hypothetical protein